MIHTYWWRLFSRRGNMTGPRSCNQDFLVIQWFRCHDQCKGCGFDPWSRELRSHMPSGQGKKEKKAPRSCNQQVVNLSWKARLIPYHHQLPGTKEQLIAASCFKRWECGKVRKLEWIIWLEVLKQTWESVAPCTRVVRVKVVKLCWRIEHTSFRNLNFFPPTCM